jgi:hypothetical protein
MLTEYINGSLIVKSSVIKHAHFCVKAYSAFLNLNILLIALTPPPQKKGDP